MRPTDIRYIVVHCSATRADHPYPVEALERDHIARGFRGAGYHFYIRRSGVIHPLRPLERIGAHALGYNRCSWGVCYEGGLDDMGHPADTRTAEQRTALRHSHACPAGSPPQSPSPPPLPSSDSAHRRASGA